ncbi:MAG: hypothetical protein WAK40_03160 [Thermoplasmata archaeon]
MNDHQVPQRIAPGANYSLSEVTISIDPPGPAAPGWASMAVPLLQKARSVGVTTFDLTGASPAALAEEIFLRAFPYRDPELVAIVGYGERATPRPRGLSRSASGSGAPADPPIEGTLGRLGDRCRTIVEWSPPERSGPEALRIPEPLVAMHGDGRILDVVVPYAAREVAGPAPFRSGPLSLLDLEIVNSVRRGELPTGFSLIARDVFASGSLDGSLLAGSPLSRGPAEPPPSLGTLHARLNPILRLGFLTHGTGRTLAQTALRFALHWPWVRSAVVPLPSPERFGTLFGAARGPELSEEEIDRIGVERPAARRPHAETE